MVCLKEKMSQKSDFFEENSIHPHFFLTCWVFWRELSSGKHSHSTTIQREETQWEITIIIVNTIGDDDQQESCHRDERCVYGIKWKERDLIFTLSFPLFFHQKFSLSNPDGWWFLDDCLFFSSFVSFGLVGRLLCVSNRSSFTSWMCHIDTTNQPTTTKNVKWWFVSRESVCRQDKTRER